jgi:hypothetical protein
MSDELEGNETTEEVIPGSPVTADAEELAEATAAAYKVLDAQLAPLGCETTAMLGVAERHARAAFLNFFDGMPAVLPGTPQGAARQIADELEGEN